MTVTAMSYARSSGQPRRYQFDSWVVGTVAALLLIGLVMVASASISVPNFNVEPMMCRAPSCSSSVG